jgi:hypothetical protein
MRGKTAELRVRLRYPLGAKLLRGALEKASVRVA